MVNVGTHPTDIGKKASKFKSFDQEAKHNIKKATVAYRTQMVTSLVQSFTQDVDFVIDNP